MSTMNINRQRLLMIVAGGSILLFVLDSLVRAPLWKAWQTRSAEIDRLQRSVSQGRSAIARSPQTRGEWEKMKSEALVNDPARAEQNLITELDRWGRGGGVEIASIKPQWKRGANNRYSLLECRIDASGSLAALTRFLYEVEKSALALRVDSVEFTSRDDSGQKLSLGLLVSGLRLTPLEARR